MIPDKTYRIDFVYQGKSIIPTGDFLDAGVPGVAVDNIYIRCDGPDPIRYSLNGENESKMMGGVITKDKDREFTTFDKIIKSINFQIYGGNQTKLAIEVGI